MSLDLFERETEERYSRMVPLERPEPGAWTGFLRGSGQFAMQGFAKHARSIDLLGAIFPIAQDAITGGVEAQDRYFREHEEVYQRAVDYWTPRPGEVGIAGQMAGTLLSLLPLVITSPGLAVASTQLSVSEDLIKQGVDPLKSQAVGAAYGAGIGLGIWVPILGRTLSQRMLLGGAGFNVVQGTAMRGTADVILQGTPAAGQFKAFSPEEITFDVLLGLAFGGLAHVSPAMRLQSELFWQRIEAWRGNLKPEDIAALAVMRAAQHIGADSLPGKPVTPEALDSHVARVRASIEQLARNEPVNVSDLPAPELTPDPARFEAAASRGREMAQTAEELRNEENLPHVPVSFGETVEVPRGREDLPEVPRGAQPRELSAAAELLPTVPRPVHEGAPPETAPGAARPAFDLTEVAPEGQPRAIAVAVEQALTRINVDPEEARANASLWESFFRTVADRYAMPAARIMQEYGLDIRRLGEQEDLPGALAQAERGPRFYSELQRQVEGLKQEAASPEQWKGTVKNLKGVKREEVKWSGIEEWLDLQSGRVTKQRVMEYLQGNGVRVEEVVRGEDVEGAAQPQRLTTAEQAVIAQARREHFTDRGARDYALTAARDQLSEAQIANMSDEMALLVTELREAYTSRIGEALPTKFGAYQLPGGANYRELLLKLPQTEPTTAERMAAAERIAQAEYGRPFQALTAEQRNGITERITQRGPDRDFVTAHFEEPNILSHIRFNERTDAKGKRVLFIEEIQSDWAQRGRKEGFRGADQSPEQQVVSDKIRREHGFTINDQTSLRSLEDAGVPADVRGEWWRVYMAVGARPTGGTIPSAPFVGKTEAWVALSLKRMILYAAENGFDSIAWTRGEQQVQRYTTALRKAVDRIEWTKTEKGVQLKGFSQGPETGVRVDAELRERLNQVLERNDLLGFDSIGEARTALVEARTDWRTRWEVENEIDANIIEEYLRAASVRERPQQTKVIDTTQREDELSDAVGKAMADRIRNDAAQSGVIEGENLRIDETGMAGFYDRILPNVANDILKKLGGGKVKEAELEFDTQARAPELREMKGADLDAFQGAEDFSDGSKPLIGRARIAFDGEAQDATVAVDAMGIRIIDDEADNEFIIKWPAVGRAPFNQARAIDLVRQVWKDPGLFAGFEQMTGTAKEIEPVSETSKQMAFEITPAVRERAARGLPLFQPGRGQIQFGRGQTVIGLFENANRSTFLHETGHFFLQVTRDLATKPTAPEAAVKDWATLAKWLKIEGGEVTREAHEQFARGFEQYLAEGKAPTEGLRGVFEAFKRWLLDIYYSLTDLDVDLSDDVRAVMGRMLGAPEAEGPVGEARTAGLPPPRPGQPAGLEAPARREAQPSPLLRDIRALGGIDQSQMPDITGERRFGKVKGLPWGVFRPQGENTRDQITEGHGLDEMARLLRDRGWNIPEENEVAALTQLIDDEIREARAVRLGEEAEIMTNAAILRNLDEVAAQFTEAETLAAERFGFNEADPRYRAEIERIRAQRDAAMTQAMREAENPLQAEAARIAREKPNMRIEVSRDEEGKPITVSLRQYLEDASAEAARAANDAKLFDIAAACLSGAT